MIDDFYIFQKHQKIIRITTALHTTSKPYGIVATIITFAFALYCIVLYCIVLYCIVLFKNDTSFYLFHGPIK